MLLNNADLKKWLPVNVAFTFDNLYGDIVQAERSYIKPMIGAALYAGIDAAYNAEPQTLTAAQSALLDYIHPSLVNLSLWLYADKGNVEFGDSGIHITVSDTRKPAFEWQVKRLRMAYLKRGIEGLDDLLAFLDENETDYPDWTDSDAQVETRELFIQTGTEYKKAGVIKASRLTYLALVPVLKRIQEENVLAVLGDDLYAAIAAEVTDAAVSADNVKLMKYIKPAMAHLSYADGLDELAVLVDDDGVTLLNSTFARSMDSREPAELERITQIQEKHRLLGNGFLKKLEEYLIENYEDYPLYGYDPDTAESSEYKPTDDDAVVFLG